MKGVVFVKFGEFIEQTFGEDFWDELLLTTELESEGIYTTVENYPDEELFALVDQVVKQKGLTPKQATFAFGEWMFSELYQAAPPQVHDFKDGFAFLRGVQNVIHLEVKKLNPDAILPEFKFIEQTDNTLLMEYISPRHLCYFCEGLIKGMSKQTGETLNTSQHECVHEGGERCLIQVSRH